jgi:hypothetical protein
MINRSPSFVESLPMQYFPSPVVIRSWLAASALLCGTIARAQAPTLNPPAPLGAQRGTALDLTLTGANLAEPVNVIATFPAKITIPTENNNGKDNAKLLVHLEVPKEAPIGWHSLRLATTRGISNFRLFCIDDLPQVVKQAGNQSIATAQAAPIPCVVCGQVNAEQTDYYKFTVATGQRVSFEVLGRRLGSPIDPQIAVLNPRTGKQLVFSDDAPGLSKDPRITYVFKEGGEYVLELSASDRRFSLRHYAGPAGRQARQHYGGEFRRAECRRCAAPDGLSSQRARRRCDLAGAGLAGQSARLAGDASGKRSGGGERNRAE